MEFFRGELIHMLTRHFSNACPQLFGVTYNLINITLLGFNLHLLVFAGLDTIQTEFI
jgi:hypothetical protein